VPLLHAETLVRYNQIHVCCYNARPNIATQVKMCMVDVACACCEFVDMCCDLSSARYLRAPVLAILCQVCSHSYVENAVKIAPIFSHNPHARATRTDRANTMPTDVL
jgi:hypothetical protein